MSRFWIEKGGTKRRENMFLFFAQSTYNRPFAQPNLWAWAILFRASSSPATPRRLAELPPALYKSCCAVAIAGVLQNDSAGVDWGLSTSAVCPDCPQTLVTGPMPRRMPCSPWRSLRNNGTSEPRPTPPTQWHPPGPAHGHRGGVTKAASHTAPCLAFWGAVGRACECLFIPDYSGTEL